MPASQLLADTVHSGLLHAFTVTAQAAPNGHVGTHGGITTAFTGSPIAFFNQILVADSRATADDWHAAIEDARHNVAGFATHLRIGSDDRFERLALQTMRPVPAAPTPGMILESLPIASRPSELELRTGPELLSEHIALVAGAFNLPVSAIESFMTPGIVDVPGLAIHVGYLDGTPVATSFGLVNAQTVSIFNVATDAEYRGRGFGRTLTEAAINGGHREGATVACLQSSALGLPVYERMGFRTVLRYAELISGSAG